MDVCACSDRCMHWRSDACGRQEDAWEAPTQLVSIKAGFYFVKRGMAGLATTAAVGRPSVAGEQYTALWTSLVTWHRELSVDASLLRGCASTRLCVSAMMSRMVRHSLHTEQPLAAICRPGRLAHAAVCGPPVRKCSQCLGAPGTCLKAIPSRQYHQLGRAALVCSARPSDQQTALSPQSLWSPRSVTLLVFWAAFAGE